MSRLLNNFFGWFFKVENPPMVNYIKTEYPEQDWEYQANNNGVDPKSRTKKFPYWI